MFSYEQNLSLLGSSSFPKNESFPMTPLSILIAVCMFITAIANSVVGATSALPADGIASSNLRPAHG